MIRSISTSVFEAVQHLTHTDESYMILPIEHGFNWREMFADVPPGEWYLVVFRSRHSALADEDLLWDLDDRAREDASHAPGFVHYFAGNPNANHECLSFCLWESPEQARAASRHQPHKDAERVAYTMFDSFQLERYLVQKIDGIDTPKFIRL